jgi:hypothetical protein
VQDTTRKQWQLLCEQAAIEKDPEKLIRLAEEINRLLQDQDGGVMADYGENISPAAQPETPIAGSVRSD